jgi:hypothetical protein
MMLRNNMKVVIIGGGIAGLSTAHILAGIPGINVVLYEKEGDIGGQASSMMGGYCHVEYSWRIFAACYDNLNKIITEIGADDNFSELHPCIAENKTVSYGGLSATNLLKVAIKHGHIKFLDKILGLTTICKERAINEYDYVNAYEFYEQDELAMSIIGPFLGLDAAKTSLSGFYKNAISTTAGRGITKVSKDPTQISLFDPWKKYLIDRDVCIENNSAVTAVNMSNNNTIDSIEINGETVFADEFVFACSLKSVNDIFMNISDAKTFRNMKKLEKSLQLYYTINLYFSEEIGLGDKECVEFVILDVPWQPIVQKKRRWKEGALGQCNEAIADIWNVGFIDNIIGSKIKKKLRDCSKAEAIEEGLYQLKNSEYIKTLLNGKSLDDVIIGIEDWYQFVDDKDTGKLISTNPKFSVNVGTRTLMPLNSNPDDIPSNMYLAGYYVTSTMGGVSMEASCETGLQAGKDLLDKYKIDNGDVIYHDEQYITIATAPLVALDKALYAANLPPLINFVPSIVVILLYFYLIIYFIRK